MAIRGKPLLLAAGILFCTSSGTIILGGEGPSSPASTGQEAPDKPSSSKPISTYNPIPGSVVSDATPMPSAAIVIPPPPSLWVPTMRSSSSNRIYKPTDLAAGTGPSLAGGTGTSTGSASPANGVYKPTDLAGGTGPSLAAGTGTSTGSASPSNSCVAPPRMSFWQRHKRHLQECFLGYPEEFNAVPLGQFLYEHGKTQVANGEAARMVLYHYDFEEGKDSLNTRGRDQLAKMSGMLPRNFFPIVIERTPQTPTLAETRRLYVLNELGKCSFPIPSERVVIGVPIAAGLSGVEAEIIYGNLLQQTQRQGVTTGGSLGGTGIGVPGGGAGPGAVPTTQGPSTGQ